MSDTQNHEVDSQDDQDSKTDAWAVMIVFAAAIFMAIHFVSGFTFDF